MIEKLIYFVALFTIIMFFYGCEKKVHYKFDSKYESLFEEAKSDFKMGEMEDSHIKFSKLLLMTDEVSQSEKNRKIHLIALNYIGEIALKAGEKKLAYKEYEQALRLAEQYNNEEYQIIALVSIVYLEDDIKKVEEILHESNRRFGYNNKNLYALDQIKYRLGLLYANDGNIEQSLEIFNNLLQNEIYQNFEKVEFYKGLGIAYKNKLDFHTSLENFNEALSFVEDETIIELDILLEKAQLFTSFKHYSKLNNLLEKIKPSIDSIKDLKFKKRFNELQLEMYKNTNDIEGKVETLSNLLNLTQTICEKSNASLGSIAVNLKNFELTKETETQKVKNFFLTVLLVLASLLLLFALLLFYFFHKYYKKQTEYKLLEKQQEVKDEQTKRKDLQNQIELESINAFINGQEEERKRYATQLHDSLGANLAAVNMHLSVLKKDVTPKSYNRVSNMLKNAIEETRSISHSIMPPVLVNQGLIAAINEKAVEWDCEQLQFEVHYNIERVALDDKLEITLYRGILECINNIITHAKATKVEISFTKNEDNRLYISIQDNGIGFKVVDLAKGEGGLGINGLRLRTKYFDGQFNIESEIDKGTSVYISVPVLKMKQTA